MSEVKKSKDTVQVTDNIFTELARIQHELKAPKGQFNKFGNFLSINDWCEHLDIYLWKCKLQK